MSSNSHFLHEFLRPKSVAIYGANNTYGTTMGTMQLVNIILGNYDRPVYPIHLRLDTVLGKKAYKSIADVPEVPDLVIIVLPPKIVPQIFRECGEKGVKKIVLISGGFREVANENQNTLTEEIIEIADRYGIRFIGPNCFGFYNAWLYPEDPERRFNMMIFEQQPKRGKFSIVSQSGTMTSHLFLDPNSLNVSLGKAISVGNEANIDLVDFLEYFNHDDNTDVIGLYIEEVKRGKKFIEVAKQITPKKPIVAVYAGGYDAGNRAISSHTGSMAGNPRIFEAMAKETGIISTDSVEEFLSLPGILSKGIYPKGRRVGIITNSGGPGAMLANNAEKKGLIVPEFSEELQKKLKTMLPPTASFKNPIDCTFDMNLYNFYVSMPKTLMRSKEIDIIIMYGVIGFHYFIEKYSSSEKLTPHLEIQHDIMERIDEIDYMFLAPTLKASRRFKIPIFYINPENPLRPWSQKIKEHGGVVFKFWDKPIDCAVKLCQYAAYRRKHS
jgi:acetyltransferase